MGRCVFLKVYRNEMWKEHELYKFLKYDKFFLKIPNIRDIIETYTKMSPEYRKSMRKFRSVER